MEAWIKAKQTIDLKNRSLKNCCQNVCSMFINNTSLLSGTNRLLRAGWAENTDTSAGGLNFGLLTPHFIESYCCFTVLVPWYVGVRELGLMQKKIDPGWENT